MSNSTKILHPKRVYEFNALLKERCEILKASDEYAAMLASTEEKVDFLAENELATSFGDLWIIQNVVLGDYKIDLIPREIIYEFQIIFLKTHNELADRYYLEDYLHYLVEIDSNPHKAEFDQLIFGLLDGELAIDKHEEGVYNLKLTREGWKEVQQWSQRMSIEPSAIAVIPDS